MMDTTITNYKATRDVLFLNEQIKVHSRIIETRGPVRQVHYLECGRGVPLVLVHGGGSHCMEWYPVIQRLSQKFHLFVVDRPGCGLTDPFNYRGCDLQQHTVIFLKTFLDALNLDRAVLVGHSMGGYFAINFGLRFPERCDMLILPGAPAGMNSWIPPMLRAIGTPGLNNLLIRTVAKPSVNNVKKIYRDLLVKDLSKVSREFIENTYFGQMLPGGMKSFLTLLENVLTFRGWKNAYYLGDKLHELKVPVRFIWGDSDTFELPESGRAKTMAVRDCRFIVVEDAGHCVWMDQPEKCVNLISEMIDDHKVRLRSIMQGQ